jgi:hypothetical protein
VVDSVEVLVSETLASLDKFNFIPEDSVERVDVVDPKVTVGGIDPEVPEGVVPKEKLGVDPEVTLGVDTEVPLGVDPKEIAVDPKEIGAGVEPTSSFFFSIGGGKYSGESVVIILYLACGDTSGSGICSFSILVICLHADVKGVVFAAVA